MFKRNVTTSLMVVAAGVLMFSGVALAANQGSPAAKAPVLVSQTSQPTDDNVKATASPELEPGDDNGVDATPSADPSFDDKGGAGHGADDATAEPTFDDKGGAGHGADDTASPTATPDDKGGAGHGADDTTSPKATPAATPDDKGGKGGHGGGSDD